MQPITPFKRALVGEWFSRKGHTPKIDSDVRSLKGDRYGEVYPGRCYQGDGVAYIDVSAFVVGTLTVKCWWKKAGGTVDAASLNYAEIDAIVRSNDFVNRTNPAIDLTTEVDNAQKRITLASNVKYYGLHIYDDGVLKAVYLGEEGDGNTLDDPLGANRTKVRGAVVTDFHNEDVDVPYCRANALGFAFGNAIDTQEIKNDVGFVNILNVDGNGTQGANFIGRVKRHAFNVSDDNFSARLWLINAIDSNGDVYNVDGSVNVGNVENALSAGLYDDGDGNGYYYVTYGKDLDPFLFRNISPAIDAAKFTFRFEASQDGYITIINQERRNAWNEYIDNSWNNDSQAQNYLDFAVLSSSGSTLVTFESLIDWYNYLQSQNRASEIDDFLTPWGVTFQEVWDFAVAENLGSTDFGNETSFDLFSFYIRIDFIAGSQTLEVNSLLTSFTNNRKCCAYFLNKTIGSVDYISINLSELGKLKVYLEDFKIDSKSIVTPSLNNTFETSNNKPLAFLGNASLPVSLVESNCLISDAVWALRVGVDPASIEIFGAAVGSDCVITDNLDGTWDIVFPNNQKIYDLQIANLHFDVAEGFGFTIEGTDDLGAFVTAEIINGTPAVWDYQDEYHAHAFKGSGTYKGILETRMFPVDCETKLKFPECPAVRAAGLDPTAKYTVADLQALAANNANIGVQVASGYLSKLVIYPQANDNMEARINAYTRQ